MNKTEKVIPKMPEEFFGKLLTPGGYTKDIPREWTEKEIEWCMKLREEGFTAKQIAESCNRGETSVAIKLKRLRKQNGTYNSEHRCEKYDANIEFYQLIKPGSILDVYCGENHFWKGKARRYVSNDINEEYEATYHMDALALCCQEYLNKNKYDLVDLDPFGSAYDCLDLAIKMAKKGLIVTYGEYGQLRWKRTDYVDSTYGIKSIDDFSSEKFIEETQRIGKHNHKNLIPEKICMFDRVLRVYYRIEPLKVTEQWETKEKDNIQPELEERG